MGQVVYLCLCLLGCLLLNSSVEGANNCTEAEARARCPHGALYFRQFCYQLIQSHLSWEEAEIQCQALKKGPEVHLASIRNKYEGKILIGFLKKHVNTAWIGLQNTHDEYSSCEWTDGSPCSFPLWDNNYPSSSSHVCFALHNIQNSNTQKWQQRSCSDTLPYICKYKADY